QYGVPISLEVARNENLLDGNSLSVELKQGTLADALNSIVKEKSSYVWEVDEGTIRVFPKPEFRDPLLEALLEIKIKRFVLPMRTAKLTFRQEITSRAELKNLLARYRVSPSNDALKYDLELLGADFSLDVRNAAVRSILNQVIKNTKTKYWFIRRFEDSGRSFLLVN